GTDSLPRGRAGRLSSVRDACAVVAEWRLHADGPRFPPLLSRSTARARERFGEADAAPSSRTRQARTLLRRSFYAPTAVRFRVRTRNRDLNLCTLHPPMQLAYDRVTVCFRAWNDLAIGSGGLATPRQAPGLWHSVAFLLRRLSRARTDRLDSHRLYRLLLCASSRASRRSCSPLSSPLPAVARPSR